MICLFGRKIGCRSLTIHRVESALLAESFWLAGMAQELKSAVPSTTFDCVTRLQQAQSLI
jgi:hypothetical protein